jgi:hypothetical protein
MVRVFGVTGRVQLVDREDVGRFGKARVTLAAQRVEAAVVAVTSNNGRSRREAGSPMASTEEGGVA